MSILTLLFSSMNFSGWNLMFLMFLLCFCSSAFSNFLTVFQATVCAIMSYFRNRCSDQFQQFCLTLQYIWLDRVTKTMNNFNPFMGMYYQIWVVPGMMPNGSTFYSPVSMYPQIVQPQPINCATSLSLSTEAEKSPEIKQAPPEKTETKPGKDQTVEKVDHERNTVQIQSNVTKQQSIKNENKKPKRPLTYLTQKAFYMRHKLKGKQKSGSRILRRRPRVIQEKAEKTNEPQKTTKKVKEEERAKKKKSIISKDLQKQKKMVAKIMTKPVSCRQYCDDFAVIPKLISGLSQLNQFCRLKIQNLMCRQTCKDQH